MHPSCRNLSLALCNLRWCFAILASPAFLSALLRRFASRWNIISSCWHWLACSTCSNQPAKLRCSRCKAAFYCDKACQKSAWKAHRTVCEPVSQFQGYSAPATPNFSNPASPVSESWGTRNGAGRILSNYGKSRIFNAIPPCIMIGCGRYGCTKSSGFYDLNDYIGISGEGVFFPWESRSFFRTTKHSVAKIDQWIFF